jgi:riboflavin kinase/FMN adenylyltransferase
MPDIEKSVVSTGNFDGVHAGHHKLLRSVRERASALGAAAVILTFEPHTRAVVNADIGQSVLATFAEKEILMRPFGIDILACLPFTPALASMKPEEFIDTILIGRFGAVEWVMGENHAFGKDRAGSKNFLHKRKSTKHFNVFAITLSSQQSAVISSTQIRTLVLAGRISEAVEMLGHAYLIVAQRIRGLQTGALLGFPTLNFTLPPSQKVIPPPGVYAAKLSAGKRLWPGACYIGKCPTFGNRDLHIEFHALGGADAYPDAGREAGLWIHSFVRKDESFRTKELLVKQMRSDIDIIGKFFEEE